MDPTTKEGREALRHIHAQMMAEASTAMASGCTPSSAPTVRWMTAATDHLLAALSHIEKLEAELAVAKHLLRGAQLERDELRAEVERLKDLTIRMTRRADHA